MNRFDNIYNNFIDSLYEDISDEDISASYEDEYGEEISFEKGIELEDGESDNEDMEEELSEAIKRKRMVRNGKRIIKYISTKPGYRVQKGKNDNRKEVRITPQELIRRKKAAKKAARKGKGKRNQASRKRKLSNKKRTGIK